MKPSDTILVIAFAALSFSCMAQPTDENQSQEQNQKIMKTSNDYTFTFESSKSAQDIYSMLLDIPSWWSGFYNEKIEGAQKKVNDVFAYHAGDGAHYSKQKLIELVPQKKIVWQVTESNLIFLKKTDEWTNSKISFELSANGDKTQVTFIHHGLVPNIECYETCTSGWGQYMGALANRLK